MGSSVSSAPLSPAFTRSQHAAQPPAARSLPSLDGLERAAAPAASLAAPGAPEPVAPQDAMFLRTRRPFVVSGLLTFDAPNAGEARMDAATMRRLVDTKLRHVDRFAACIERDAQGRETWVPDAHFDAHHHVREAACAGSHGGPEFMALVERLHNSAMDPQRPRWDMTVIACGDGRTAVLVRTHHAMADGMRLMQAMLECNDNPAVLASVRLAAQQAMDVQAAQRAHQAARQGTLAALLGAVGGAIAFVGHSARLLGRGVDPQTCLKPRQAAEHMLAGAMHTPWQVDELKALAKQLGGGTLNDVLLAVVTGALRRVMLQHGDTALLDRGIKLHGFMPINTLPVGTGHGMGNAFAIGMPSLPVGEADTQARYDQARAANHAVKASGEPYVAHALSGLVGRLPERVQAFLVARTGQQTSALITNVRGPSEPVSLQGHTVNDVRFFMPAFEQLGVMFPVITYCGRVNMGLNIDARLHIGIAELQRAVEQEYQALQAAAQAAP